MARKEIIIRYYTVKQYASMYGKSERTIRRWISLGKISAKKDPGGRNWVILVQDSSSK